MKLGKRKLIKMMKMREYKKAVSQKISPIFFAAAIISQGL